MAEAIVKLVLNKLAEAAIKETLHIYGAGAKLDSLQRELRWIRVFLKDAETKQNLDEMVKSWVSEVREVAYRIEDVIDTFIAEIDGRNRPGMINALKRVLQNPMKLPIVRKLLSEMDAIQTRLVEIEKLTERYGVKRELNANNSAVPIRRFGREVMRPDEEDPDVIGLEKDKENILKLLLDPNTTRRCVVSIVGQGGLGKTTLARKVYSSDEVKRDFDFRLWLSASQQFKLTDLLKVMLEGIRPLEKHEKELLQGNDPTCQQKAKEHFIGELNVSLKEIRYLIVVDDVWTQDLWIQIENALPNISNGSRVLITTRFSEIAKRADTTYDPYNLRYLSPEESRQLLLKKAFFYQDPKDYLDDLSDLPEKFAKKCCGLALALVVVGGLLSREQPTYISWHKIFEKLNWHDGDGKMCTEILATSYEDMPAYLKPCFMYFASFPEDYQIKVKPLIRMWVSEGFIPKIYRRTMEETAEEYLEELVQRSMIQVSVRGYNGSIKYCHIHDLLRELAIEKAKENNFLQIISNQGDQHYSSTGNVRRTTLHCYHEDIMAYTGPNLRSLLYFGDTTAIPNVDEFRRLKVLCHMMEDDRGIYCFVVSKKLTQLRFVGNFPSRRCIGDLNYEAVIWWESISQLRNLQTIDIPYSRLQFRADCIWNIKTLRHVILSSRYFGPPPMAHLPNLQTLKTVKVRDSWMVKGWPKMPNIRVLRLHKFPPKCDDSFHTFLSGLRHLTSLHIDVSELSESASHEMLDMSAFPSYNHMQSLYVTGDWNKWMRSKALDIHLFPIHLRKLTLWDSHINEDPFPIIEKLKSLKKLRFSYAYDGKQLSCSAQGFPHLEYMEFSWLQNLEDWRVEKGGMPLLKEIRIEYCFELVVIPELQHMTRLNNLTLKVHPYLRDRLREKESYKIKHIPFIKME
ncbi:Disease resistance family protein [Rhynchospora pubera]|uniref:Disease resistance family protein n=1 Tax=Rhynchospora pubera TaxID=906938 RepID=A0AAV8F833_9POAL|nr:Disease resistance family protein [Rhynchospora pubera]